ncbi:MAG: HAD hydrolase-like protein [Thermoplasmata archaeon]|jgi:phosphoglycolate phosphatase-like HAD superfamily hydrolase
MVGASSHRSEIARPPGRSPPPDPVRVERGVVIFDLDGTLLDDLSLISHVAGDVMHRAFGTPPEEARIHYLATTGLPFEAQLAQLYPTAPAQLRASAAATFHQRKVTEAYAHAGPFPEVPGMLKRLAQARWTLVVSTGGETEMAELVLEREGLRFWFDAVLGSREGTKREHLVEYRRRYLDAPLILVGDSRFDMETAQSLPGVVGIGRASRIHGWALTPGDLAQWGAAWADYSLAGLPEALEKILAPPARSSGRRKNRPPGTRK